MRRGSRTFFGAAALGAAVACAACDGDDTQGMVPAGDAGGDATTDAGPNGADGGDASATDAGGGDSSSVTDGGDASTGDAAPPPQLACTTWKYATPLVLEDLSADASPGFYEGRLWVGEPAAGQVSVITHPSDGPTFRVYGLNKASSAITTVDSSGEDAGAAYTYESARHFASVSGAAVTQVLVQEPGDFLAAYFVPDSVATSGPVPRPLGLATSGYSFAALPFADGDVYVAAAYEHLLVAPEVDYALGVGLATPTAGTGLTQVALSASDEDFEGLALAHENGQVYVFASNNDTTEGASVWVVPDDGGVPAPVTARAFDTAANARLIDVAAGVSAGTTNIAHASGGSGGAPLVILAGQVPAAQLGTVTAASLVTVRAYDELAAAPFVHAGAEWVGDDIMLISPGVPGGDAGVPVGANVLWLDAKGNVRSEEVGANAVLQTEGTSITSIVASPASVTSTAASWDVAWIESRGAGQVLLYNELDCE